VSQKSTPRSHDRGDFLAENLFFRYFDGEKLYPRILRVLWITFGNRHQHIQSFDHLTKHGMLVIQPGGGHMGDKKLAAIGIWTGIRHGKNPGLLCFSEESNSSLNL